MDRRLVDNEVIERLAKKYDYLEISMEKREGFWERLMQNKIMHDIVLVKGLPMSPDTILRFQESIALEFIVEQLNGLKNITLLPSKAALLTDRSFFSIIDYVGESEIKVQLPSYQVREELVPEIFVLHLEQFNLNVRMGSLSVRPYNAWKFIERTTSKEEFLENARKSIQRGTIPRDDLSYVWDALLYTLVLGSSDYRPTIHSVLSESFMENLPPLHKYAYNFLIIEPVDEEDYGQFRQLMMENWQEIIRAAIFEYYTTHKAMTFVVDMSLGEILGHDFFRIPEFLEKAPSITEAPFRRISPEQMQYLLAAEKSRLPSFRFLSFYHVLEHFYDEVNYRAIHKEIKRILESPNLARFAEKYAT